MIQLENLTPDVYYKQSRDFQFIGRLYDIVLNSVKTNSNLITQVINNDALNINLVDLMALTLGFESKHNYNMKQLTALCSAFEIIIRQKGTRQAIRTAIGVLLNAEGLISDLTQLEDFITIDAGRQEVTIFINKNLSDTNLLKDLLDYILPAGMTCNIVRSLQKKYTVWTEITESDYVKVYTDDSTSPKKRLSEYGLSIIPQKEQAQAPVNGSLGKVPGIYINSTVVRINNKKGE